VLLSRLGRARKRALTDIAKGGARDALQVLANGGVAAACAVVWQQHLSLHWAAAFAGAFAAATADTWGTEVGTLARRPPRSIVTFRPIATGLSGGVTLPGTLAEIAGALWLGLWGVGGIMLAYLHALAPERLDLSGLAPLVLAVPVGGIAGALLDSLLGATVQELRSCPSCERACEGDVHACGTATRRIRGIPGVTNDAVNLAATLAGAAVAFALA
jgi:uncharacterized protein (TIGR00297 family)